MGRIAILGMVFLLMLPGAVGTSRAQTSMQVQFEVGQVWRFEGRPVDPDPTLVIVALEDNAVLGKLVHVSISGVSMANPVAPSGAIDTVSHMPFTEDAVHRSVTELAASAAALPDFEEGYWTWKQAFDNGEAGVWSLSVGEAVEAMEQALNQ